LSEPTTNHIIFLPETRQKIGAVTYIVAAHFDENQENLQSKIKHLLKHEIEQKICRNVWARPK